MITAEQVHNIKIPKAFFGYSISSVDQLLEKIETQLLEDVRVETDLLQKNTKMKQVNLEKQTYIVQFQDRIEQLLAQVDQLEKELAGAQKGSYKSVQPDSESEQEIRNRLRKEVETQFREEIDMERQSHSQYQTRIDQLLEQVAQLEKELAEARSNPRTIGQTNPDLAQETHDNLRKEIESQLRNELGREHQISMDLLQDRINQLQKQVEQLEKELSEAKNTPQIIAKVNTNLGNKERQKLRQELESQLRAEITKEKQTDIDLLQSQIDQLEKALAESRKAPAPSLTLTKQPLKGPEEMTHSEIRQEIDLLTQKVRYIEKRLGISQAAPKKINCKPKKISKIRLVSG